MRHAQCAMSEQWQRPGTAVPGFLLDSSGSGRPGDRHRHGAEHTIERRLGRVEVAVRVYPDQFDSKDRASGTEPGWDQEFNDILRICYTAFGAAMGIS